MAVASLSFLSLQSSLLTLTEPALVAASATPGLGRDTFAAGGAAMLARPKPQVRFSETGTLRDVAAQALRQQHVSHDEAWQARRAALTQIAQGSTSGSIAAVLAAASLQVGDAGLSQERFRITEFSDKVLTWLASAPDEVFLTASAQGNGKGLRVMAAALVATRSNRPEVELPLMVAALQQFEDKAGLGSTAAILAASNRSLSLQVTSLTDRQQLNEQAVQDLSALADADFVAGGNPVPAVLRALAKHTVWTLSLTEADTMLLRTAALSHILRVATPASRVAAIASGALREVQGSMAVTRHNAMLKAALEAIHAAGDGDF